MALRNLELHARNDDDNHSETIPVFNRQMDRWTEMVKQHSAPSAMHDDGLVSEMTYTVSSGTLNSTIPYHTMMMDTL